MKFLLLSLILSLGWLFLAQKAEAIVFLPALILIPIAKIVVLLIGGFSLPALGVGVLWSKLCKKSIKQTLLVILAIFLILTVVLIIILKIENPSRPLF